MKPGLLPIYSDRKDYSFVPTFGAAFDTTSLPDNFSIYNGELIPNQNQLDTRFTPATRPLTMGCVAETTTFIAGLEDKAMYPPDDFYFAIPPGTDTTGRDIRTALTLAKRRGFKLPDGTIGAKKGDYYNCYGSGKISDSDAVRIALWVNQTERRGVSVGSWWYPEFVYDVGRDGTLPIPSFNTKEAALHNYFISGWRTMNGKIYFEVIPWLGMMYANQGIALMSEDLYNALLGQPYTAAYTLAPKHEDVVTVGMQATWDHIVAILNQFIFNKFGV